MSENQMTDNIFYFAGRGAKADAAISAPETDKSPDAARTAESQLVEKVLSGEKEAFDKLYKLFAPMVHGIVLARAPYDEADDLVQNVFLTAYKNLSALRDKNAVGAWLAQIARNHAAEFYRRAKPTEELPEDLRSGDDRQTEATEVREILAAIRALPEAYCETLIMRLVEGLTGAEIAVKTGLTPESVRVNLHRGMKLLRRNLGIEEKQ